MFVYLGVPYAKPPIKELRFAAPVPHPGWNRTLSARNFKPICPQIDNNVYEEVEFGLNYNNKITSEDCLYVNVWAPEVICSTFFEIQMFVFASWFLTVSERKCPKVYRVSTFVF